jgi:hypothetical protein
MTKAIVVEAPPQKLIKHVGSQLTLNLQLICKQKYLLIKFIKALFVFPILRNKKLLPENVLTIKFFNFVREIF